MTRFSICFGEDSDSILPELTLIVQLKVQGYYDSSEEARSFASPCLSNLQYCTCSELLKWQKLQHWLSSSANYWFGLTSFLFGDSQEYTCLRPFKWHLQTVT